MRFSEIESGSDVLQWYSEIYNPFGYIKFLLEEDKDYWEKAEHGAIATATVALPFHALTAMSSGGYWANLPPGTTYRTMSMKKFTRDLFYSTLRRISITTPTYGSKFGVAAARAVPAVMTTAAVAGAAVATHDLAKGAVTQGRDKPDWIPLPIWAMLWS